MCLRSQRSDRSSRPVWAPGLVLFEGRGLLGRVRMGDLLEGFRVEDPACATPMLNSNGTARAD